MFRFYILVHKGIGYRNIYIYYNTLGINMTKDDNTTKIRDSMSNEYRREIIKILEKEGKQNISKLTKKIGIGYKSVWNHVKNLEATGLINTKKITDSRGKNVFVELNTKYDNYTKEKIPAWKTLFTNTPVDEYIYKKYLFLL